MRMICGGLTERRFDRLKGKVQFVGEQRQHQKEKHMDMRGGLAGASGLGNSSTGQLAQHASAPMRESQVAVQMNRQRNLIESIAQYTGNLMERLSPVLRPDQPSADNSKRENESVVGHATDLSIQNERLTLIQAALASIMDRIEL